MLPPLTLREVFVAETTFREANVSSGELTRDGLGKPHLSQRQIIFLGIMRAMVGVYSSL
jgi:hypothetical protein